MRSPYESGLGTQSSGQGRLGHAQLSRLFRIVVMLQSEPYPNARAIAEHCEVSRRTVHRDLQTLEAAGVPLRYDPERRGYHLARGFFLPPPNLTEQEGIALLLLTRAWSGGEGLGLSLDVREGAMKLSQGLPPALRDRVLTMAGSLRTPGPPQRPAPARGDVRDALLDVIVRPRQLRVWYREEWGPEVVCTKLGLYRLVFDEHCWYLVGRSSVVRRVVVIGLPWIERAVPTDDPYEIPPRFNLRKFLARSWGVAHGGTRYSVWLRFSALAAPRVRAEEPHRGESFEEVFDGRLDMHVVVNGLDEILRWVLAYGDQVEVLGPPELRQRFREVAGRMTRLHEPTLGLVTEAHERA